MGTLLDPYRFGTTPLFPVVEARAQGVRSSGNGTAHTITLPSGIVAGNLLLVVFSSDGAPVITVDEGTSGANWDILGQEEAGTAVTGAVIWKIAEGSDALTLTTDVAERSSHISFRISNATSLDGTVFTPGGTAGSNSDPPEHTPAGGSDNYLWIASRSGDGLIEASAAPNNYTPLTSQGGVDTNGASTSTAERSLTASSEDPGTFTSDSQQWVSWTIAVAP